MKSITASLQSKVGINADEMLTNVVEGMHIPDTIKEELLSRYTLCLVPKQQGVSILPVHIKITQEHKGQSDIYKEMMSSIYKFISNELSMDVDRLAMTSQINLYFNLDVTKGVKA